MKIKNLPLCIAALSLLLFSACASFRTRDFSSHAPLALVTVVSNQDIYWLGENPSSAIDLAVTDFVRDRLGLRRDGATVRISNAGELINEADEILRKVLSEAGVFRLVDKELVINSQSYTSAGSESPRGRTQRLVAARGYRFIEHNDRRFAANLSRELGANSLLFVTFEFNKEMVSGFGNTGTFRARVTMETVMVNASGRRLFRDEITTLGSERIAVRSRAYYQEDLMDMLREAIGEACYRFIWQFSGTRP